MSIFWINNQKHEICDWEVNFSDRETWQSLIQELLEENTIIQIVNRLLSEKHIKVGNVPSESAIQEFNSMISDNLDTINFIKFGLDSGE